MAYLSIGIDYITCNITKKIKIKTDVPYNNENLNL